MSTILIVGDSFHTLRDYLSEHGYRYIVLQDIHRKSPPRRFTDYVTCDFADRHAIEQALNKLQQMVKIDGVMTIYENYVLPAARIARRLELPGLPIEAAQACTDKLLMRQKLAQAPYKISPDFQLVTDEQSIRSFASTHTFPLMLKPANLAKSLLVTKSDNLTMLLAQYEQIRKKISGVYERFAPYRRPKLLIEEFMEGSTHSVDAFVDSHGNVQVLEEVVDYQTGRDMGFDDNFHYSRLLPSSLQLEQIAAIREVAVAGCQALGMKSSPAHIEVILTAEGPKIVEIGARNGGYRERMHGLANGIDILGNALRLALDKPLHISSERHDPCAVLELFPKTPGIFRALSNQRRINTLPSIVYCEVKAHTGEVVGKAADGYKMCAIVMLHNKNVQQFHQDLSFINEHVRVVTT